MDTNKLKPTLKHNVLTTFLVEYNDLEEFIKTVTGHVYEIPSSEEWGNDSSHLMAINGTQSAWSKKEWETFKKDGGGSFKLRSIMEGLCSEGFIAAGVYNVRVSW